jgi:hypothetical protein
MSLHALAGHMATKGRGGDSMLVHMTPGEVQALQALAERHGGTLTINPETGQPEANFLKKLLPMVAGFALGPAGFGLMSAGMAGLTVGGLTTLATGSLSRGLMAGLGAYGGAGLGASLANAGTGAMAASDIAAQQAAGTFPTMAEGMTAEAYASQVGAARDAALAKAGEAGFGAKMSAGFGQMASNPGMYGREILTGLAAISPMMADQGVQTTTKRPDTGTIRNFTFDPYGQTYSSAGNYPASEYKGMAQGGIVALAEGGGLTLPEGWGVAGGQYSDPSQKIAYFNQQGITPAQLDAAGVSGDDIAWMQKQGGYNVADAITPINTPAGWGNYGGAYDSPQEKIAYFNQQNITPAQLLAAGAGVTQDDINWMLANGYTGKNPAPGSIKYVQNVQDYFTNNPNATYAEIQKAAEGLNPADVQAAMAKAGLSGGAQFAAFNQDIGDTRNIEETYSGLRGLSSNINYWLQTHPGASLNDFKNEMSKWLLDENDIKRATGKTSAELFTGPITSVYNPAEGASGSTGAGVEGGGTVVNPNGTITTSPRIPGIPVGGFTGMGQVRDAYTTGGGSLGYVNPAPKTMEEFEQRFNRQTGDSLAAYNYLMGQGANPVKSGVGEIMRPYGEAVRGIPAAEGRPTQKFIYQNGRYVENPNYRPLSYNSKGERIVGLTSTEVLKGLQGLADPTDDVAALDWMTTNNVTVAQLAAALNIPFAEALARYNAAKAKKAGTAGTAGTAATDAGGDSGVGGSDSGFGGGGGEAASNNAPVESMGGDTGFGGDGANAGVAGGGNAAGGPGNSGDGGTGDSSTAVDGGFGGGDSGGDAGTGATGGDGTGSGADAGSTGDCVDPAVLIMLGNKTYVPAGTIKVGDVLFAMHENTHEFGLYPVEHAEEVQQPKAVVTFHDGSTMTTSHSHKFFMTNGAWKQVYQIDVGDVVKAAPGEMDKTVTEVIPVNDGPVMKITVKDAHTYISEGLISHNMKARGGRVRQRYAVGGSLGGLGALAAGGATSQYNLGGYSDGGRLLKGPGDGVSDSIPATIGNRQPARLADGEFVIPARIVSELGNGSTEAGARKLYAMMDRVQKARGKTTGKNRVAANTRSDKYLPA